MSCISSAKRSQVSERFCIRLPNLAVIYPDLILPRVSLARLDFFVEVIHVIFVFDLCFIRLPGPLPLIAPHCGRRHQHRREVKPFPGSLDSFEPFFPRETFFGGGSLLTWVHSICTPGSGTAGPI